VDLDGTEVADVVDALDRFRGHVDAELRMHSRRFLKSRAGDVPALVCGHEAGERRKERERANIE
jgi:hypothetical protein